MFLNKNEALNSKDICNLFAKNFEFVYLQAKSTFFHQSNLDHETEFQISVDEITSVVQKMKKKISVGPDGLSAYFINMCSTFISQPLMILFNQSLREDHCLQSGKNLLLHLFLKMATSVIYLIIGRLQ